MIRYLSPQVVNEHVVDLLLVLLFRSQVIKLDVQVLDLLFMECFLFFEFSLF